MRIERDNKLKAWKNGAIIVILVLVLVSSGCIGASKITTQPAPMTTTTVPPKTRIETVVKTTHPSQITPAPEVTETSTTTPAPITTSPTITSVPTTQPPETVRTTNPNSYVLTLEDVGSDYLVAETNYENFEARLDEGMMGEEDRNLMKDWGFIESYTVSYGTETEGITNMVSRHGSRDGARKRLDYLRDMHSNREDFPEMISVDLVAGREFGDDSFYVIQIFKFMGSETDVYPNMISLDFSKDNYHVNILRSDSTGQGTISDLYPLAEIIEKRITDDEQIITPTA